MKKTLIVTLALVFVLGLAGTAFANPYSDVPAGHWAYKAVMDLTKAGVVEGYNGKFQGQQNMTRYEMAAITARAMAKADKAGAADKATIDKLAVEFSKELNDLGVRVAKLEKNSQNIKWTGTLRQRYESTEDVGEGSVFKTRLRLMVSAGLDENWTFKGRIAQEAISNTANNNMQMDHAYVTGKLGETTLSVGRMPNVISQMLVSGSTTNWDGVTLAGKLGDANWKVGTLKKAGFNDNEFVIADADFKVIDNVTLTATYMKDTASPDKNLYDTTAFGVKYDGIKNILVQGEFAKNKAEANATDAKAKWYQVKYKGASAKTPGTFGVWVNYKTADKGFDVKDYNGGDATTDVINWAGTTLGVAAGQINNVKGYEYGVDYTLFKNGVLSVVYYDLENRDGSIDYPKQVIAQVNYSF